MWFAEQLDSFLNLGICKEYPNMAKSKSTAGSKTDRSNSNTNKEQVDTSNPANIPDVKAAAAEAAPAEVAQEPMQEPKTIAERRKLKVVQSEPRKNVVVPINAPINRTAANLEDEIRRRAYELYLQRGNAPGSEAEDWLAAEREVRQRYRQQSA
jgi:hypothetical protein